MAEPIPVWAKRPHHSPNRTGAEMEQLGDLRREHPTKGGHVLARMLKDRGHNRWTKSTITAILRRHRLIEPADSLKHKAYRRFEHQRPNDLWQMDSKGHIPVGSCGRCHPLTVLDDHSRFSFPWIGPTWHGHVGPGAADRLAGATGNIVHPRQARALPQVPQDGTAPGK